MRVGDDPVLHGCGHGQVAVPGPVHQTGPGAGVAMLQRFQRRFEHGGDPGIAAQRGQLLVGHQFGLKDHPDRAVQRFDVVVDGRDRALGERDQPDRGDPHRPAGRGHPLHPAGQRAGLEVQHPLVAQQPAVAHVERLVVDQQPDQLAVGDVDQRLAGLRVSVAGLRVGQRALFVEPVQVRPGQAVRLPLVQVRPPADVSIGQGEQRLGLGQQAGVQFGLAQAPRVDRERWVLDHRSASRSARSLTTTSAPDARSASAWPTRSTPTT